jgi:hypothetical protein
MINEEVRERVCEEMDWWRSWMFERVKVTRGNRPLEPEELVVCAILASASLALAEKAQP